MDNSGMIHSLVLNGVLKSPQIIEAFNEVDRADFIPKELKSRAYNDYPLPIGQAQTISQPYTVAFMLELLQVKPTQNVLDLGSGSGWTSALLARMSKSVDAVERIDSLISLSKHNLLKYTFKNIRIHKAKNTLGLKDKRFDKILVSCAADEIPKELLQQLLPGGVMVIPIGNSIIRVRKTSDESIQTDEYPGFVFVPLIK